MQIIIYKPYIVEGADTTRLCADVEWNGQIRQLWYETEKEYGEFFTTELSDAFVVTLLLLAMEKGADIVTEGGCSERLIDQLNRYLIPVIAENIGKYSYPTKIIGDKKCIHYNGTAVGTGLSCGVDSFYSVYRNLEHEKDSELRLTHLCFLNAGNNGGKGGELARQVFQKRRDRFKMVARETGLQFMSVDCNINEYLQQLHVSTHTFRTLSMPLALQKLFHLYYFASGYNVVDFCMDYHDSAHYDILTLPNLCTESIRFVLTGSETTRNGKVEYISQYPVVQKYLHVCLDNKNIEKVCNCGKCKKCKRTMLNLYLVGKLDSFREAFDVDAFYSNKDKIIRWAMAVGKKSSEDADMKEIRMDLKKKHLIGWKNYTIFYLSRPYFWGKDLRKKIKKKLKKK